MSEELLTVGSRKAIDGYSAFNTAVSFLIYIWIGHKGQINIVQFLGLQMAFSILFGFVFGAFRSGFRCISSPIGSSEGNGEEWSWAE
jgi:hypothetical protein